MISIQIAKTITVCDLLISRIGVQRTLNRFVRACAQKNQGKKDRKSCSTYIYIHF